MCLEKHLILEIFQPIAQGLFPQGRSRNEDYSISLNAESSHFTWKAKFHCRVSKHTAPDRIVSQLDPGHTIQPYCLKIHSNIIIYFTPRFP